MQTLYYNLLSSPKEGRTDVRPLNPTPPLHSTNARTRETRAHANVYKRI